MFFFIFFSQLSSFTLFQNNVDKEYLILGENDVITQFIFVTQYYIEVYC